METTLGIRIIADSNQAETRLTALRQSLQGLSTGTGNQTRQTGELSRQTGILSSETHELIGETRELGSETSELSRRTMSWNEAVSETRRGLLKIGAASVLIVQASKAAIRFESAMADVKKTVGGTDEEIASLGREIRQMSHDIPLAADELARIAANGGQLGIAAQDISQFTSLTAKMAVAFDMTADTAGDAIGKLMNVYNLGIEGTERLGDAINQLGNNTAARERDIVNVMLRIGGSAEQFGLAEEKTAALAAAMLSLGKPPEVAGTAINALLNRMQTANMQSETFKQGLTEIGLSAEEMAAMVANQPQKALDTLLQSLASLEGQQRAEVLTKLFGAEFQDDIGVLVGSMQTYQNAMQQVGDQTAYAGAMQQEFATRSDTTENSLVLLKNVVVDIIRGVGDGFIPVIKNGARILAALLKPVAQLTREFPHLSAGLVTVGTGFMVFNQARRMAEMLRLSIATIGPTAAASFGQASASAGRLNALIGKGGQLLGAFSIGYAIGTFLNQFKFVRKGALSVIHTLDLLRLKAKHMWASLTGGDVKGIEQQMANAKEVYRAMLKDIEQDKNSTEAQSLQKQQQEVSRQRKTELEKLLKGNTAAMEQAAKAAKTAEKAVSGGQAESNKEPDPPTGKETAFSRRAEKGIIRYAVEDDGSKKKITKRQYEARMADVPDKRTIALPPEQKAITSNYAAAYQKSDPATKLTKTGNERKESASEKIPDRKQESNHQFSSGAKKTVELKFRGGSLQGSQTDVDALLRELEQAGLTA
ncbi:MAG: phage tail tape measure protein [Deltaproteobacteria bacterium]|nr:MAG: phage tail tape measure protein [Deltaproteobacteria bacterium]